MYFIQAAHLSVQLKQRSRRNRERRTPLSKHADAKKTGRLGQAGVLPSGSPFSQSSYESSQVQSQLVKTPDEAFPLKCLVLLQNPGFGNQDLVATDMDGTLDEKEKKKKSQGPIKTRTFSSYLN